MEKKSCIRQKADILQIERSKELLRGLNSEFELIAKSFELLKSQVRLKILYLLHKEERLCVCDLSDILNMTIPAVSQHLKKLKIEGLVETKQEAQTIYYSLKNTSNSILEVIFNLFNSKENLESYEIKS